MIIKKDTKFRISNINPDWYSMGITKEENNEEKPSEVDWGKGWVIDGRIWVYDEEYCEDYEVCEMIWETMDDRDEKQMYEDFIGFGYCDGVLYDQYGLLIEDGIEIQTITEKEFEDIVSKPLNLEIYRETLNKVTDDLDRIVLNKIGG